MLFIIMICKRHFRLLISRPILIWSFRRQYNVGLNSCLLQKDTREREVISTNNIVRSPYRDITIPTVTVNEYVWQNIEKWSDKTALVCGVTGKSYTFAQIFELSKRFASSLHKNGFKAGDILAVMLQNIPEYPVIVLGALEAGLVVSTVNPIYTYAELKHQLEDSDARVVVTSSEMAAKVREVIRTIIDDRPKTNRPPPSIITVGSAVESSFVYEEMVSRDAEPIIVQPRVDDLAFLPYSSGTTGLPKGVLLTHSNIVSNFEQLSNPNTSFIKMTTGNYQDVMPAILPFFHIYGLTVILLRGLSKGCKIIVLPKFEPLTFLSAMKDHKSTVLYLVPPIILFLGNHKSVTSEHFTSVKYVINGAGPVSALDGEKVVTRARKKDFVFSQAYGLTETSPGVFKSPPTGQDYSSVGMCIPSTSVKLYKEDGRLCAIEEKGEICVKGPQVMKGYHNNAAATAEAIDADGYFHTGDVGYYDEEGRFFIVERLKELIKVKGLQVPPAELEGVLRTYPGVLEAAVVGIPDKWGDERPLAFVVKDTDNKDISETVLKKYVAEKVAPFKRIRGVVFVDSLPKTSSGKILRRILKENYFKSK